MPSEEERVPQVESDATQQALVEAALQESLRSRTVIGQAMGLLMRDLGITGDAAFAHLVQLSSHRNVKLREVAAGMVRDAESGLSAEQT